MLQTCYNYHILPIIRKKLPRKFLETPHNSTLKQIALPPRTCFRTSTEHVQSLVYSVFVTCFIACVRMQRIIKYSPRVYNLLKGRCFGQWGGSWQAKRCAEHATVHASRRVEVCALYPYSTPYAHVPYILHASNTLHTHLPHSTHSTYKCIANSQFFLAC